MNDARWERYRLLICSSGHHSNILTNQVPQFEVFRNLIGNPIYSITVLDQETYDLLCDTGFYFVIE